MFTALLSTRRLSIDDPLAIRMPFGFDGLRFQRLLTYGTNLMLTALLGTGGISIGDPLTARMSLGIDRSGV